VTCQAARAATSRGHVGISVVSPTPGVNPVPSSQAARSPPSICPALRQGQCPTVDRATLHNTDVIKRKGVLIGAMVVLRNAGELAEPLAADSHGDAAVGQVDVV
jgi:hypothetical protein